MKRLLFISIFSLLVFEKGFSQTDSYTFQIYYRQALKDLEVMLRSENAANFKDAVFTVENAYLANALSKEWFDSEIKKLVDISRDFSEKSTLLYNNTDKNIIELHGSLFVVMTSKLPIMLDSLHFFKPSPFVYDFEDFWGERDWSKMFVSKLLQTHKGNCHSLPFLYKIVANELGVDAWLAMAPNHTYIKLWSKELGWYNTELTSATFPIDAWVMASGYIKLEAIQNGVYMDTLSNKQSIAVCVTDLAEGYKKMFQYSDPVFLLECADLALEYYPNYVNALILKAETLKATFEQMQQKYGMTIQELLTDPDGRQVFNKMEKLYFKIHNLGYRAMPKDMYLTWLSDLNEHKDKYLNKKIFVNFNQTGNENEN